MPCLPLSRLCRWLVLCLPLACPADDDGEIRRVSEQATFPTVPEFAALGYGQPERVFAQEAVFRQRARYFKAEESEGPYAIVPYPLDDIPSTDDEEVYGQPRVADPYILDATIPLVDFAGRVREAWESGRGGVVDFETWTASAQLFEDADGNPLVYEFAPARDTETDRFKEEGGGLITDPAFSRMVALLGRSGTYTVRWVGNSTVEEQNPPSLMRWEAGDATHFMVQPWKSDDLSCFSNGAEPGWVQVDTNPDPAVTEFAKRAFLTISTRDGSHTTVSGIHTFGSWTVHDLRFPAADRIRVLGFALIVYKNFQRFQSLDGSITNPFNIIAEIRMTNPELPEDHPQRHAYSAAHATSQECLECATAFFGFEAPEGYFIDRLLVRGIGNNCRTFDRIDDLSFIVAPSIRLPDEIIVPYVAPDESDSGLRYPFLQRLVANNDAQAFTVEGELPPGLNFFQDTRTGEYRIAGIPAIPEAEMDDAWSFPVERDGETVLIGETVALYPDVTITALGPDDSTSEDDLSTTVDFVVRRVPDGGERGFGASSPPASPQR